MFFSSLTLPPSPYAYPGLFTTYFFSNDKYFERYLTISQKNYPFWGIKVKKREKGFFLAISDNLGGIVCMKHL